MEVFFQIEVPALGTVLNSRYIKQAIASCNDVKPKGNKAIPVSFFQSKHGKGNYRTVYMEYANLTIAIIPSAFN